MNDVSNGELARWLQRVEQKMDTVEHKIDLNLLDHETRMRHIERWVYGIPPTILLAIGSVLVALFGRQ